MHHQYSISSADLQAARDLRNVKYPIVPVNLDGIHPELTQEPLWSGWLYSADGLHKPPYGVTGYPISVNTPAAWTHYDRVVQAFATGRYAGIGRLLTATCPYTIIDLDDCLRHNRLTEWAWRIIKLFMSRTEYSPSGTGVKIIVRGNWPLGYKSLPIESGKLEVFSGPNHYFTVTGQALHGTPTSINERQDALLTLAREYWPGDATPLCFGGVGRGLRTGPPHTTPKTQGGMRISWAEPPPRLLRRAESFPATYVEHHPRGTDRSAYFMQVTAATVRAWGKGVAWALRTEIDRVSGGKYGLERIDDEMRRALNKMPTKGYDDAD